MRRRFIWIFPELWIVVGISVALIMILAFDEISFPWFFAWILAQSTVMQFWTPDCLRGYGVGGPNGTLWTITVFAQVYIVVYVLHKILHKRDKTLWGNTLWD